MGWNFRKSIKVGKGVRINLSKSGVGISAGVKGLRVGANKRGVYTSQSIPGTGLYKREYIAKSSEKTRKEPLSTEVETATETITEVTPSEPVGQKPRRKRGKGCLTILAIFLIIGFIGSLSGISVDQAEVLGAAAADQIKVRYASGSEATVQLAGIERIQGEADAAALNYVKTSLIGQTVYVQKAKADRNAGFIWTAKPKKADNAEIRQSMFNAALLLNGYTKYSSAGVDDKYRDPLIACEAEAKQAQLGTWAPPAPPSKEIAVVPAPEPKPDPAREPAKEPAKDTTKQTANTTTPSSATTPAANKPKVEQPKADPKQSIVYITNTGAKYHRSGCRHLSKSKISINLKDAQARGYTPCKVCSP